MIDETTYYKLQDEWRDFRNALDPLIVTTEDGDILTWNYDDQVYDNVTNVKIVTDNTLLLHLVQMAGDTSYLLNLYNKEIVNEYTNYLESVLDEYKKENLLTQFDQYTVNCICDDDSYGSYVTWLKDAEEYKARDLQDAVKLLEESGYIVTRKED